MACVTLLSDFGQLDASVSAVKGLLLSKNIDLHIVDITHEVRPFNLRQAAYLLTSASQHFPSGTIHIAMVDVFREKTPTLVACLHGSQIYLVPDNGILPRGYPLTELEGIKLFELSEKQSFTDWIKAAADFASRVNVRFFSESTLPKVKLKTLPSAQLDQRTQSLPCEVVHIDQHENVVVNFTREQYALYSELGPFRLQFIKYEEIREIKNNYADVTEGRKLCRFNANGYLEIAVNKGKAASLFGLKYDGLHNNIKICFG